MSTSQTSRINGITTERERGDRLGGRAVNSLLFYFFILFLFCTSCISESVANNKVVYYFHVKCIQNFAPDGHGTKLSCVGGGVRV